MRSSPFRLVLGALVLLALACEREHPPAPPASASEPSVAPLDYVGVARCTSCHATEAEAWRGSDHDRAMQLASAETLVGDFSGARVTKDGTVTTFFERDGRHFVNTEGPDGALSDFEVAYGFGVHPLQQLLLPLPGGRLQAFTIAWDARPQTAGGQRWYSLYPDEATPAGDVLHWATLSQNWNGGCADCHSTNLRRGYDPARAVYETTWSDLDVACEACHGPGSRHAADESPLPVPLGGSPARWVFDEGASIARRDPPRSSHAELDSCAPCHARRTPLAEGGANGAPLLDRYRPSLLEEGLYHADGQIQDEVYEYGSFVQSRMHDAGVTCSDCHEPHSLALRAEGNALCGSCHQAAVFDTPAHHRHAVASAGADCVACHMPSRTYMGVDVRHDHSFRVPRPDLSLALDTPNACNDCHTQQSPRWAAEAVRRWFPDGRSGTPHYGEALHAGRNALPGAEQALRALVGDDAQPGIARATALTLLAAPELPESGAAIRRGLADPDPLVRLGALLAARGLEPGTRLAALKPLLRDPLLAVRSDAARALAEVPAPLFRPAERSQLAGALAEYRATQDLAADRPDARLNLALLDATQGDPESARRGYQDALRLAPWFVPAWVNLADIERSLGREDAAEHALRQAIAVDAELAEPHFALGLLLIRTGRRDEAFTELSRAAALAPDNPRLVQGLALALEDRGEPARAMATLEDALVRRPGDRTLLAAAAFLAREHGDLAAAQRQLRALLAAWPDDEAARKLLSGLEQTPP